MKTKLICWRVWKWNAGINYNIIFTERRISLSCIYYILIQLHAGVVYPTPTPPTPLSHTHTTHSPLTHPHPHPVTGTVLSPCKRALMAILKVQLGEICLRISSAAWAYTCKHTHGHTHTHRTHVHAPAHTYMHVHTLTHTLTHILNNFISLRKSFLQRRWVLGWSAACRSTYARCRMTACVYRWTHLWCNAGVWWDNTEVWWKNTEVWWDNTKVWWDNNAGSFIIRYLILKVN